MVDEAEIIERLTKVEERSKSNTHQIEELKPVVNEIHEMSKTMVELIGECRHTNESVSDIKSNVSTLKSKVEAIEKEPASEWRSFKRILFTALASAIIGAIVTGAIAQFF